MPAVPTTPRSPANAPVVDATSGTCVRSKQRNAPRGHTTPLNRTEAPNPAQRSGALALALR